MLNIVIPMAGRGSRFAQAGFDLPKPLIPVHGSPMIEVVVNNVRPKNPHQFIFLVLKDHVERFQLKGLLDKWAPGSRVVVVDRVTEGAACTVLLARDYIDNDEGLMLVNSDQWVDIDIDDYLSSLEKQEAQGLIMTMKSNDPKWSFVRLNEKGHVREAVEKEVVSEEATVGIYNFSRGRDFVSSADRMIGKNIRVNGEFYVAPVFNQLIASGGKVVIYNVGAVGQGMYGLGTPADLEEFLRLPVSLKAVSARAS